ncbi:hypothetical protein JET76_22885 [Pseudomonas putida]|uniref:hypothetical protein n=1 Tax=Pseudomonas putida TaxID=303 RepID=UPI0018E675C8|nr:hypothetical protein [Pseudomonas putida]MBI6944174.1 hypothetical protein [Pseudomonas putida]MBI6960340.1 hypothetical protein [Pseudomonas putida]
MTLLLWLLLELATGAALLYSAGALRARPTAPRSIAVVTALLSYGAVCHYSPLWSLTHA